jgi:hypothetical protein
MGIWYDRNFNQWGHLVHLEIVNIIDQNRDINKINGALVRLEAFTRITITIFLQENKVQYT